MTSGIFRTCPIDQIIVNRDDRQRKDISDISDLKDSIQRLGLIHPPVITREYVLVSGERRLAATKELGWDTIPFQFQDDMDELILCGIELEENIKRKELPWLDEVGAIDKYHHLRLSKDKAWTTEKTGAAIGVVRTQARKKLLVARILKDPNTPEAKREEIAKQDNFSAAARVAEIEETRQRNQEEMSLKYGGVTLEHHHTVLCIKFEDWIREYSGPKFNFVHCDFPYGINFDRMGTQAGTSLGRYEDSPEVNSSLVQTFCEKLDIFAEDICHFIFWFSMSTYQRTYEMLSQQAGISIEPFPLIWFKSDNTGISPDAYRSPRRVYETAFFGSRGNPSILGVKANLFAGPPSGTIHPHEKPEDMLNHFFQMVVDRHTSIFDPTCGSGSALRAARTLGASRILGLEANEHYARLANAELEKDK